MSNLHRSPYKSQQYVYIFKPKLLKFSQEYSEQLQCYRVGEISSSQLPMALFKSRVCSEQGARHKEAQEALPKTCPWLKEICPDGRRS